jgi:myosin-18
MFNFMKKDKEHRKEKEEKKKEKKEKKEKEKKDKHREHTTPEELNRLEEIKRGVFKRKSDKKKDGLSPDDDDGGFLQRDSDSSTSLGSAGRPSPGRENRGSGDMQQGARPPVLPKPKSILKSKGDRQNVSQNLDDTATLKSNTLYNVEMSGHPVDNEKAKVADRGSKGQIKDRPPEFTPPPPPDEPPPEKTFQAALKLPDIIPSKPPRVRELVINRSKSGGFGFTLRKGSITQKGSEGKDVKQTVIFAEPGAGQSSSQTGLIPGDRLIEVNGVNVEHTPREEIIEMIKKTGDTVVLKVQPIPELVELSVRPTVDGSSVEIQEDVMKGGTLKRSGSLRYKKMPVSVFKDHMSSVLAVAFSSN